MLENLGIVIITLVGIVAITGITYIVIKEMFNSTNYHKNRK